jgi:hypothetical protein
MATISFGTSVNHDEAVKLVAALGTTNTFLFRGEPGVGKSSMLKDLAKLFPEHEVAYIDCANLDLGDIAMPFIDRELNCTRYYPNAHFKLHTGRPVIIMLDEITKASQSVQNMLLPLILEGRLGDMKLPEGSLRFATGNLTQDGVGDHLKAHAHNRMTVVQFRKPTAEEWIKWAVRHNVTEQVIAFVDQYPEVMASYLDPSQSKNSYIFNPKEVQSAFCSPRSLEMASNIFKKRSAIGDEPMLASFMGVLGESGARALHSFINLDDKLPTFDSILADPHGITIPSDPIANCILVYKAVMTVKRENIDRWMIYLERLPKENQGVFARTLLESDNAKSAGHPAFIEWATRNNYIFAKAK